MFLFLFSCFSVLLQRRLQIPNLHLWNGSLPDPYHTNVGVILFEGAVGGAEGHLAFPVGIEAEAQVGLLWEKKRRNIFPVPSSSKCLLKPSLQPATSPSLTHVSHGSEGGDPQLFCHPSHVLLFFHILANSHAQVFIFPYVFGCCCFCCSHSFGGATLKGSYGQPCLTRDRPGSQFGFQ